MKYLIISGNPKSDGLCAEVIKQVQKGTLAANVDAEILTVADLDRCDVCDNGWGTCRNQHVCAYGEDGFNEAQDKVKNAEQICIVTPVYWGEMAEGLKGFLDRLRRCEYGEKGALAGKQILLIASPGGSGRGALTCLEQMERFCNQTSAVIFDYIAINRWNSDYKKEAVFAAAKAMASGRKAKETI